MYFEQFYLTCLSHASYMIGSEGVAAVIDPQRDVALYMDEAARNGLRIAHVIETHLHADFVSGHQELAGKTGARIYLGDGSGAKFPHVGVKDGDEVQFGRCRLRFLQTPGHTLESVCVMVTDLDRSEEPFAVLTGDTLFIGDVGRPDLSPDHTPQQLAGLLFDSLHTKLLTLPDSVEIYPAHGAGSMCGRQLGAERKSTIGQQKLANYALQPKVREEFVRLLTAELPERPGYFALDAEINRAGAAPLEDLPPITALLPSEVQERQSRGVVVLDTRPPSQFGSGHIPGAIQIGLSGQYATWAGTLLGLDQELILVAEDEEKLEESRLRLARVGIEKVIGSVAEGMAGWTRAGLPAEPVAQISVQELSQMLADGGEPIQVVDVRRAAECEEGVIDGAMGKPLNKLTGRLDDLQRERPVAVYCKGGYRSSIACSLLQREGFRQVINIVGGFDAWKACSLPIQRAES